MEPMNRMHEHFEGETAEAPMMSRCTAAAESAIQEHPLAMTLALFGVGLGLGVVVGSALAEPMGVRKQPTAENLGRKILDSIAEYLPASVQKQLHT
ncbi:hypothetical protein Pan44_28770 [Caulifigura coniformis]|uniref:Uncharacterized protein n=1 Tax=Caulifigura coniformis TaxID=2527983 RepID=A0A517SFE0_9PLAN|nr:hypothetical protein [Caulifigura coniformis]QDT54839.1 hypothetical protein Pan44_28770 [Caulifigura coniformis]